ncbi:MAG UNVERIFIED_CONTAM: hypothetical protein LVR18_32920 [Planctomycetaceae bacterium]|jgi:hypothetical protein
MPKETVKLPDDSIRLGVEGDLYLLRDELVDMVAEKAVYMSIAKKASAAGDKPAFENAVTSIDALPARQQFSDRLDAIRSPGTPKGRRRPQRHRQTPHRVAHYENERISGQILRGRKASQGSRRTAKVATGRRAPPAASAAPKATAPSP